ncbi:MAG TPA: hypothetical protein VER96_39065 [Polyangiaceae bacterium]|nr:hypothetical protein [Polyangiaceae bacterium]
MSGALRPSTRARLPFALLCCALSASTLTGCYHYAVAAREGPPNNQMLPFDRTNPQTKTQWQFAWGLSNKPVYAPIVCTNDAKDANGNCLYGSIDPCHGKGIALYEVNVPWYLLLTTGVTLGIVSGVRTTFYCSTAQGSQSGPQSISGPH